MSGDMSALTPEQQAAIFAQLVAGLTDLSYGKYALLAGFTLGLYDHLQTLDSEIRHIWRAKTWTASRAIFLFTRYSFYPLMITHIYDGLGPPKSNKFCAEWTGVSTYWTYFIYAMMHWLVALRVYAYWGKSKAVFYTFVTLWGIAFIVTTIEASIWVHQYVRTTAVFDPVLNVCTFGSPKWLPAVHVSFLVLEIPAFFLTAYKYRLDSKRVLQTTLINTLIQDGILYFFLVLLLTIGTSLFVTFAPLSLSGIPRYLTMGLVMVTVTRLVLGLREAAERSANRTAGGGVITPMTNDEKTYVSGTHRFMGHARNGSRGTNQPGSARPSQDHRRGLDHWGIPMGRRDSSSNYRRDSHTHGGGGHGGVGDSFAPTWSSFNPEIPAGVNPDQTIIIGNPYTIEETDTFEERRAYNQHGHV